MTKEQIFKNIEYIRDQITRKMKDTANNASVNTYNRDHYRGQLEAYKHINDLLCEFLPKEELKILEFQMHEEFFKSLERAVDDFDAGKGQVFEMGKRPD